MELVEKANKKEENLKTTESETENKSQSENLLWAGMMEISVFGGKLFPKES